MTRFFRFIACLVVLGILFLSLEPAREPSGALHADKINHLIAYGVLTTCLALGWPKWRLPVLVFGVFLFGCSLEIAQGLGGQGRTASVWDAVANLTGSILSAVGIFFLRKK